MKHVKCKADKTDYILLTSDHSFQYQKVTASDKKSTYPSEKRVPQFCLHIQIQQQTGEIKQQQQQK